MPDYQIVTHETYANTRHIEIDVFDRPGGELIGHESIDYGLDVPIARIRAEAKLVLDARYARAKTPQPIGPLAPQT